ncbi:TPA: hypothetical protein ACQ39K_003551 [Yersinia enterocolitica]
MNNLELSNPVAWTDDDELADMDCNTYGNIFNAKYIDIHNGRWLPLYSQGYIDFLIAQLEAAHGSIKELESKVNHYVAAEYAHKHFDQTPDIIKRADSAELELVKVKAALSAANEKLKGEQVPVAVAVAVAANNGVTAENLRVIKMLLDVCGTAFELADDSCQQDVDGELCHVVPDSAFSRLSDALGEIENTLPDEYEDLPNIVLQWAAIPRHALQELFTAAPQPAGFKVEGNADAE